YSQLVFIYKVLIHFKKWAVYDSDLITFERSTGFTYNLYDIFQQNQYLIETYSRTKFWKSHQQFIEFLMIMFILTIFLPRIFIQYNSKEINHIAVEKARNWLEKYIPSWKSNKWLKTSLILTPKMSAYLTKFKFKNKYVSTALKNKVF
ncbi:MAG: hypothetical protein LBM72_00555, partial [Mycoplasmataceae bacterium]|nr:hypothetical protein [Mycoplasmataceae bacterium]